MNPAGTVRDDGDALVFERPTRLCGDLRAVEPHRFGHDSAVVGEDAGVDVEEVLRVQGRRHQEDVFQRNLPDDEQCCGVKRGERDALAGTGCETVLVAEGVHCFDRLRFPIRDHVTVILVQSEMLSDSNVEIVGVPLIAEKRVGTGNLLWREEIAESFQFSLLPRQAPRLQIEVEDVVVHDELLDALDALVGAHGGEIVEPGILTPPPNTRRENVRQDQTVHQFGKDEQLHIGERHGGGLAFGETVVHGETERRTRGVICFPSPAFSIWRRS